MILGLFLALVPACGGDDDDGGPGSDGGPGGVDAAAAVTADQFCSDYQAACGFGASHRFESRAQCMAAFENSPNVRYAKACD